MELNNFINGLQIFQLYFNKPDGFHIGAEHDQIYVYNTDHPMHADDVARVVAIGWFQPEVPYEDEFLPEMYNPEEGWSCYV